MYTLRIPLSIVAVLMAAAILSDSAEAQPVTVQFLNRRSGKPIKKGSRVVAYFESRAGRQVLDLHTDSRGVIQFDAGGAMSFQVSVVGFVPCGEQPVGLPARDYSVDAVPKHGLLSKNDCGTLNSEPLRGRLLYFVRPATLWELFKN